MSCAKSFTIVIILLTFLNSETFVFGFSAYELLSEAPHLASDFHQIIILTDGRSNRNMSRTLKENNLILAEVQWNDDGKAFLSQLVDVDDDANTAIFIEGLQLSTIIFEIAQVFDNNTESNRVFTESIIPIHYPWNAFYFLLWPKPILTQSNKIEKNSKDSKAREESMSENELEIFLRNISHRFPLNSNVFCLTQLVTDIDTAKDLYLEKRVSIWEVYSVKGKKIVQKVEQDILRRDFLWKLIKFKYHRRRNFHQAVVTATAVYDEVYFEETRWKENSTTELDSGVAVLIYRIFRDSLNYSENAIVGQYMLTPSDNSSEEMHIYLISGEADIAITESAMGSDKAQLIQYLHSVSANWLQARFAPSSHSILKFFASPFSHSLWISICFHLMLMLASMTLFRYNIVRLHETEDEFHQVRYKENGMSGKMRFFRFCSVLYFNFLWILGTLCQQGWYEWPTKTPMKILCFVASTTGFLLFAAYAGTITSQLSVSEPNHVTFENLLNWTYKFYLEIDFDFPVENNHSDPSKNYHVTTIDTLESIRDAIGNLTTTKTVLLSYPEFFYAGIRKGNISDASACECFTTIRASKQPTLCAMAVSKSSEFKEIFNIKTLLVWERGILARLTHDYNTKTHLSCEYSHSHKPQKIHDIFAAFAMISLGLIISLCVLFIEICTKSYAKFVDMYYDARQMRLLEKRQLLSTVALSTTESSSYTYDR